MIVVSNIKEVVANLDAIIAWSKSHQSPMGYFAALYRSMTISVQKGIAGGVFEDGPRMERLDTLFAGRYLQAWEAFTHQQPCSNAWYGTFSACSEESPIILQHLLMGVNAHINLDLGIAAANTAPGAAINSLQGDFDKINDVIAGVLASTQAALARIFPPLQTLHLITNGQEAALLDFSIGTARKTAWANALLLASAVEPLRSAYINTMDNAVEAIGNRILQAGTLDRHLLQIVRMTEGNDVARNIDMLMV